ncbi:hypothetical protein GUITHDRAFT_153649 [Guillardia theta CCMP2712]|uniref:Uncharacterized protein n=1 Tax=Guillardia theta (strain CCMP2712) TaxID=905079 RepID=L1J1P3_GUITC|nr:hypothetical protein GUITHDRAFT_153649 [Guillardia theta CCMP2712]EKX42005.1 hypothetical protein GUITHDRAFT_153649 [Guillardia theta CCMP2712]|eukprot:XP_005828985.1 hypothetical protein GUITHDRAFT_153649 [Guillardia theta CCMP2712]
MSSLPVMKLAALTCVQQAAGEQPLSHDEAMGRLRLLEVRSPPLTATAGAERGLQAGCKKQDDQEPEGQQGRRDVTE